MNRYSNIRALVFFALLSGCGDCGSCGPDGKTEGDAEPSATETAPLVTANANAKDAGRVRDAASDEDAASDAGRPPGDAGHDANDPAYKLPEGVARPSGAPMPLGDLQSCGVFDNPLCVKECPKGNCRQECDGVTCELTCKGGWCSQLCGPDGKCKMTCPGGHCVQVCKKADDCVRECSGGDCR